MGGWTSEEALMRPLFTLAFSALVPFVSAWILRMVVRGAGLASAWLVVSIAQLALVWSLGMTALGPAWVPSPTALVTWVFAAICAAITYLAGRVAVRRVSDDGSARWPGWIVGLIMAAALWLSWIAARELTRIPADDVVSAGEDRAIWRLRVDPWDGEAMLAWAWSGRRIETRRDRLTSARQMGADEARVSELDAELFALEGHCDRAHHAFDHALEVRASRVRLLEDPLTLGNYNLPPALVTRCPRSP
jgi:hypothetical protein